MRRPIAAVALAGLCLTGCAISPVQGLDGADGDVLFLEHLKDGDSFVATDGVEYRVGLINTPERSECGGSEAMAQTAAMLAYGFVAQVYAEDTHGRQVARVRTSDGDIGVQLARLGFANDRYLDSFRSENPSYAAELELAFGEAYTARAGLWSSCWSGGG
jgi:endonuclease YncB( thermonuclease family)